MTDRRQFLQDSILGASLLLAASRAARAESNPGIPRVVSTWDFGVAANQAAWAVLAKNGRALDAVEAGARVPEVDLRNHSVGRAGYPDRDGHVTLDASIMDEHGNCGAVAAIEHIAHPISVARRVMEKTPHVLLVGDGALQFAIEQGFPKEELLTPESRKAWQEWLKSANYKPAANSEVKTYEAPPNSMRGDAKNHDTHRHARDRCERQSLRRVHDERHGVEAARPRRRQPDHRRGARTSTTTSAERHRPASARKSSATAAAFSSSS